MIEAENQLIDSLMITCYNLIRLNSKYLYIRR